MVHEQANSGVEYSRSPLLAKKMREQFRPEEMAAQMKTARGKKKLLDGVTDRLQSDPEINEHYRGNVDALKEDVRLYVENMQWQQQYNEAQHQPEKKGFLRRSFSWIWRNKFKIAIGAILAYIGWQYMKPKVRDMHYFATDAGRQNLNRDVAATAENLGGAHRNAPQVPGPARGFKPADNTGYPAIPDDFEIQ